MTGLFLSFLPVLLATAPRARPEVPKLSLRDWLTQPSGSVFIALLLALIVGGGLQGLGGLRARRVVRRLEVDDPEITAIEEASQCGRAAIPDLFRLLEHPTKPEIRHEAGRALCRLWKADELVAEEEMAILVRGRIVQWHARRKYPRALAGPIALSVDFGVPFLDDTPEGIRPENLKWAHRISGTGQVVTEQFSDWKSTPARADLELNPDHYPTHGPHKLVLAVKVRTEGLTSNWEREFPQVPFSFEFDPNLRLDSILTVPDERREREIHEAIRLVAQPADSDARVFVPLTSAHALGNRLLLKCEHPLPSDLAHQVALEVEGLEGQIRSGRVVLPAHRSSSFSLPIVPESPLPLPTDAAVLGPRCRVRAILTVDPSRAWSSPEIRSVWPGQVATPWLDVDLFRR